jgi:hypothetical protein
MKRLTPAALTLAAFFAAAALYAQTRPTLPRPGTKPAPAKPTTQTKPSVKNVKPVVLPAPKPQAPPPKTAPVAQKVVQKIEPPAKPLEPANNEDPDYYPYGKRMTRASTTQGVLWTLTGDAQLLHKETKFLSDTVLYNEDNKIASAPGKLRMEDPQNTLTSDSGVAYYKKELRYADMTGDVKIIARPKPDDPKATPKSLRKEFKNPVTITCDKLRYWWKQKRAFTDTNVKITFRHKEKDWTITGGSLEYFGNDERALIKGSVVAVNDKGERILSDTADIILKEGAEKLILEPILKGTIIKGDKEDEGDGRP